MKEVFDICQLSLHLPYLCVTIKYIKRIVLLKLEGINLHILNGLSDKLGSFVKCMMSRKAFNVPL